MLHVCKELPKSARRLSPIALLGFLGTWIFVAMPASAQDPNYWTVAFGPRPYLGAGTRIDVDPWALEGYDGGMVSSINADSVGVFLMLYRVQGVNWTGPSGFYYGDPMPAFGPGESKTWWDIYLWAHDQSPEGVVIRVGGAVFDPRYPPAGYVGHLALDAVPEGYTGQMEWWLDMTREQFISLPIPEVDDPLQGTRFHVTVYAPPVPEPASLLALCAGMGALALRRRL